jgi:hypothetical protein
MKCRSRFIQRCIVLNDHLSAKRQRARASRGPFARLAHAYTTHQAAFENAFPKAICPPTPGVLKSLDHAGLPQSKQNISQFEPAEAVF